MRVLKFRAWDKEYNTMYDVVKQNFNATLQWAYLDEEGYECGLRQNNIEVMQFTGLQDVTGKDIYEGDIMNLSKKFFSDNTGKNFEIVSFNGAFRKKYFGWDINSYPVLDNYSINLLKLEIIGNIYENPELLEEAK